MDISKVLAIKEDMERAEARRLQPHFIASFFIEAFHLLGGSIKEREPRRYEITHVPNAIQSRDRLIGNREPILSKYERITFHKELIAVPGKPLAEFVCPGHPLLDATIDLILERHRDILKRGAVLIDPSENNNDVRVLYYLEHSIQDARSDKYGNRRIVSREMQFAEIKKDGSVSTAGYAPYLDYRPVTDEEKELINSKVEDAWIRADLEAKILGYAVEHIVPRHFDEVQRRKEILTTKTMAAVKDRLTKEINYWDHRAEELKSKELAGKTPRLNSGKARQRADELQVRLQNRMEELEQERHISPLPPVVIGGAIVIPEVLLKQLKTGSKPKPSTFAVDTKEAEQLAMEAVMNAEKRLGRTPKDVSKERCGYDIESLIPKQGRLVFIEVKGRQAGSSTITVTKNEVLTALNKPDDFVLAIVEIDGKSAKEPLYLRVPFQREPDFGVTSINYNLSELLGRAEAPR